MGERQLRAEALLRRAPRSLLGLAIIHDYPEEGAILSRNYDTWKNCSSDLMQSYTNNITFCTWSRSYQQEVFGPSGPRPWGGDTKHSFCFCKEKVCFHPLAHQVQPVAFGVFFLQFQISLDHLVLQVLFSTFHGKEANEVDIGDWDFTYSDIPNTTGCTAYPTRSDTFRSFVSSCISCSKYMYT